MNPDKAKVNVDPAWIRQAVGHVRFWLRKLGLNARQRRLFWLALAERELREGERA